MIDPNRFLPTALEVPCSALLTGLGLIGSGFRGGFYYTVCRLGFLGVYAGGLAYFLRALGRASQYCVLAIIRAKTVALVLGFVR